MKTVWERLIRFEDTSGRVVYGEPILPDADFDIGKVTESNALQAKVLVGADIFDTSGQTQVSDETVTVKKLLGPLEATDVPAVRCIGLNYMKHSQSLARWK